MSGPLAGLTVLDLTRLLPGPFATWLLADLGARVVKVESPSNPDYLRFLSDDVEGMHAGFALLNRNKENVALRFETPEGAEMLRRMVAQADVLLESNRPGVLARFGLDYASLQPLNPRLLYCSLSGYGQSGSRAQTASHDLNLLSLLGVTSLAGDPPRVLGFQMADLTGGMLAALAVLAALPERERTGVGRHLDVSLADGAFTWSCLSLARALVGAWGEPDLLAGASPGYRYYRCGDGLWLGFGGLEAKFQKRLGELLADDWEGDWPDEIFTTTDPALHARLERAFLARPRAEWLSRAQDACLEPVLPVDEVARDPWLRERGLVTTVEGVSQPGSPLAAAFGLQGGRLPAAPGAHTRAWLQACGYSEAEQAALIQEGIAFPEA